jgi:hypothetical protein
MELQLIRTYYGDGTNGLLCLNDRVICRTIELPWKGNQRNISCIPEGRYPLVQRSHPERAPHLLLQRVPGRSLILIHPANNALKELRGCIAPVTRHTGEGCGSESKKAFYPLIALVYDALEEEPVFLNIYSFQKIDNATKNRSNGPRIASFSANAHVLQNAA